MTRLVNYKLLILITLAAISIILVLVAVKNLQESQSLSSAYTIASTTSNRPILGTEVCDQNNAKDCFIWQYKTALVTDKNIVTDTSKIPLSYDDSTKLLSAQGIPFVAANTSFDFGQIYNQGDIFCISFGYLQNLKGSNPLFSIASLSSVQKYVILVDSCQSPDSFLTNFLFK